MNSYNKFQIPIPVSTIMINHNVEGIMIIRIYICYKNGQI